MWPENRTVVKIVYFWTFQNTIIIFSWPKYTIVWSHKSLITKFWIWFVHKKWALVCGIELFSGLLSCFYSYCVRPEQSEARADISMLSASYMRGISCSSLEIYGPLIPSKLSKHMQSIWRFPVLLLPLFGMCVFTPAYSRIEECLFSASLWAYYCTHSHHELQYIWTLLYTGLL